MFLAGLVARRGANSLQVRKPEEQAAGPMTKAGMTAYEVEIRSSP